MRWTLKEVAEAVGSPEMPREQAMARVAGVTIDSRTTCAGELFIAIHGPSHDGDDYVAAALERGAVAAMVAEGQLSRYPGWMQSRCLPVADTFIALHQYARAVR